MSRLVDLHLSPLLEIGLIQVRRTPDNRASGMPGAGRGIGAPELRIEIGGRAAAFVVRFIATEIAVRQAIAHIVTPSPQVISHSIQAIFVTKERGHRRLRVGRPGVELGEGIV